jgi:hypothetical protein
MDLRVYYRKLREIAEGLEADFVVVKSLATADGGVAGRLTEASKTIAARLLLEGVAELAPKAEAAAFRRQAADQQKAEEQRRAANAQVQFTVLTETDLQRLRNQNQAKGGSKE